ncbi:hypothetical protein [Vitiosangium sp. GDMCC 1.1324]|uniref:hypothetical protein n=1 Tax=Vitiosangium sp. (strain GDMCC 1.1324) TaxID=2138576 RepID=UPI0018EEC345|nr:hypothetical protein [Vitiosangium sp. GDMCC 1.1324]
MTASVCAADEGTVNVLYAGSLVNLMERSVGPAFEKETGLHVFISASPKVNTSLVGAAARLFAVSWRPALPRQLQEDGVQPVGFSAGDRRPRGGLDRGWACACASSRVLP